MWSYFWLFVVSVVFFGVCYYYYVITDPRKSRRTMHHHSRHPKHNRHSYPSPTDAAMSSAVHNQAAKSTSSNVNIDDSNPSHKNDPLDPLNDSYEHAYPHSGLTGVAESAFSKVSSYIPSHASKWFSGYSTSAYHSTLGAMQDDEDLCSMPDTPVALRAPGGRDAMIEEQMKQREEEYTNLRDMNMFVGTWNVNGRFCSEPIDPWLMADLDDRSSGLPEGSGFFDETALSSNMQPDMFILGFQELDLSKEAYVFTASTMEDDWRQAVELALRNRMKRLNLPKEFEMKLVRSIRLVGMMLLVYVTAKQQPFVRRVAAAQVGTGIMGRMGNKGAVAIRFEFHNSSICIVNSHLAAGGGAEVYRRHEDFRAITQRLVFVGQDGFETSLYDHELVIWLGDLNYRITKLSRAQVIEMIDANSLANLAVYDELIDAIKAKMSFADFREAPIEFMPTYKYDVGTTRFDSSGKVRTPAWCDRVLWRNTGGGNKVRALMYASIPSLVSSDHKPVVARLCAAVQVVDAVKYKRVYENVLKSFDKMENEYLPTVSVSAQEFDFGDLAFLDEVEQTLRVKNTGRGPVQFDFIKPPNSTSFCKPWLSIRPHTCRLQPGQTAEVQLIIHIDKRAAPELNAGRERLDDTLILRLRLGRDFFIIVKGRYMPTCFGQPLDVLIDRCWHVAVRDAEPMTNKKPDLHADDDANITSTVAAGAPPPVPPRRPLGKSSTATVAKTEPPLLIDLSVDDSTPTKNPISTNQKSAQPEIQYTNTDIPADTVNKILSTPFAQLIIKAHAEEVVPFEFLWLLWDLYCRCMFGCKPVYTKTGSSDSNNNDDRLSLLSEDDVVSVDHQPPKTWTKFEDDIGSTTSSSASSGASSMQTAQLFQLPGLEIETRAIRDALDMRKIVILTDADPIRSRTAPHAPLTRTVNSGSSPPPPPPPKTESNDLAVKILFRLTSPNNGGAPPPPPWPLMPVSVHSAAEALLIFLEALPDSLVPTKLYHEAIGAVDHAGPFEAVRDRVLPRMPRYNRATLICLMGLLRELTGAASHHHSSHHSRHSFHAPVEGGVNALKKSLVEKIFGPVLLRAPITPGAPTNAAPTSVAAYDVPLDGVRGKYVRQQEEKRKAAFVKLLLVNPVMQW